eukprot:TRINITY_DN13792_c0_g1_i1.p2 TRINITY_DN13792_c0_g1~~TRINITY_DN13792_c0_g1_i1.p2  ORF type:complete len:148 (+),score=32.47 TRINITY_DN13792_c0_g1_i1:62-505(+)
MCIRDRQKEIQVKNQQNHKKDQHTNSKKHRKTLAKTSDEEEFSDIEEVDADTTDEFCLFDGDQTEARKALDQLESPIKEKDEFQIFKDIVVNMKMQNQAALFELFEQLPEDKKVYLRELLAKQRVILNMKNNTSVVRKIVSITCKKR